MHHEEQVIEGVLRWRSSPDGEWTAYTPEQLTQIIEELKDRISVFRASLP